jgi:hypothetical protein
MPARQPSASFADRDASRSHGSIMTVRDAGVWGGLSRVTAQPAAAMSSASS